VNVVIVGCGRVGALLAATLDSAGHEVAIVDVSTLSFDRLPDDFKGTAIRGNGTDEEVLRRAGTQNADLFLALTEGDNRNVMSAQIAAEVFDAKRVIAKINDPLRAEAYAELGIATICRTDLMTDAVLSFLGMAASGAPGVRAPAGAHPGADHPPVLGAVGLGGAGTRTGSASGGSSAMGSRATSAEG
jgi:trk system potassium uptake protein TrkA